MENCNIPKRRRLNSSEAEHSSQSQQRKVIRIDVPTFYSVNKVFEELSTFKSMVANTEDAQTFIKENAVLFASLISFCQKMMTEIIQEGVTIPEEKVHQICEIINFLGNICNLSSTASHEIRKANFFSNSPRFFECTRTPSTIKASMLKLIGTIVKHSDFSSFLLSNLSLFDRIALEVYSECEDVSNNAFAILEQITMTGQPGCAKAILSSNGCYCIGVFIAKQDVKTILNRLDVFHILYKLSKYSACKVGIQLSLASGCSRTLITLFCEQPTSDKEKRILLHWKKLIIKWVQHSYDFRDKLGKNAIDGVLSRSNLDNKDYLDYQHYEFLSLFLKDPYGRSYLRETGAFDKILSMLGNLHEDERSLFQSRLLEGFDHIAFDCECLAKICFHPTFLSSTVARVQKCLSKFSFECNVKSPDPFEKEPIYQNDQSLNNNVDIGNAIIEQCCSSSNVNAYESPPRLSSVASSPNPWSPSMSPVGNTSPTSSSSFLEGFFSMRESPDVQENIESEECPSPSDHDPGSDVSPTPMQKNSRKNKAFKQITQSCLKMISNISHLDEKISICLVREETLETLVKYISDADFFNNQLARALIRLARNQTALQSLIKIGLHRIILCKLVRRRCILSRFSKTCSRCELRKDFGRELLLTLVNHIDTPLGWYLLQPSLSADRPIDSNDDLGAKIRVYSGSLVLIRSDKNRNKFYQTFKPVETLVGILVCLVKESYSNKRSFTDSNRNAQHCWDIISSLSTLLNRRGLTQNLGMDIDDLNKSPPNVPSVLLSFNGAQSECALTGLLPNDDIQTLKFYNKRDELIAEMPKELLCESIEYFAHKFVEALEDRQRFVFNEDVEACSQEDFVKFLHLSIGCPSTNECAFFNTGETYSALLFLADKYICNGLIDRLLVSTSIIDGNTLKHFLSICFSVPHMAQHLHKTCMLVLLRYTNFEQLCETLNFIAPNPDAVGMLEGMLLKFVLPFTDPSLFVPNPIGHYLDF